MNGPGPGLTFEQPIFDLECELTELQNRDDGSSQIKESIRELKKTGLPFNIDYMFGLPFQTPEKVEKDMEILLKEEVPTITIYRLRNADRQSMGIGNKQNNAGNSFSPQAIHV